MFWDSSALITLLAAQPGASELEKIARDAPSMVLWWGTRVELASGACRLRRSGNLDERKQHDLFGMIERVTSDADQIEPTEQVRAASIRVLRVHSLRAADALQLAAALAWTDHSPSGAPFVCLDKRLREAAEREGFTVLPELAA